jgi:hypothetical protein
MKPDLKAIRERCEAATAGDWGSSREDMDSYIPSTDGEWTPVAYVYRGNEPRIPVMGDMFRYDSRFIAHARTDIPALLDYIAELEKQLQPTTELQRKCPACGGLGYAKEKP